MSNQHLLGRAHMQKELILPLIELQLPTVHSCPVIRAFDGGLHPIRLLVKIQKQEGMQQALSRAQAWFDVPQHQVPLNINICWEFVMHKRSGHSPWMEGHSHEALELGFSMCHWQHCN